MKVKVGDLVKFRNDPAFWLGHGVVLKILPGDKKVLVRWFDDWKDSEPLDVERILSLEVISER